MCGAFFFITREGEADSCRCTADVRASFAGLHKGDIHCLRLIRACGMGFIALWWRALLWRWTVTLLSKWNHRLASIPREKAHLLSKGEFSRGGYARWRLHTFFTQLPCIQLWSEKTDYAKAKVTYNIFPSYTNKYNLNTHTHGHRHTQIHTHLYNLCDKSVTK